MDDIQNVGNQAGQVVEECLNNPLVVRRILEHFTNTELLDKLSFVNKLWNYEARSVLRKRGDLVAKFKHHCRNPNENFRAFGSYLRDLNVAPFSELRMDLRCSYGWPYEHHSCPYFDLDSTLDAIFDKLMLKQISIKMDHVLWSPASCAGFELIKKIVEHYSGVLEILSLEHIYKKSSFWLVQNCNFPRLKTLKLGDQYYMSPGMVRLCEPFTNFIKLVLSKAPNLQAVHSAGDIIQLGKLLQGTSVVLFYNEELVTPFEVIQDSLIGALKLRKVALDCSLSPFDFCRFSRITPILLQASMTTLCEIRVDVKLAVPLMCYGVSFKNVKNFLMWIDYHQLELIEPRLLRIVKTFDFTQIFPGLENVKVCLQRSSSTQRPDYMNEIIELASAVMREPQPHRALNIKQLKINGALSNAATQFFAEMFPNIEKLQVGERLNCTSEFPFGSIWKHWKDLEQLQVYAELTGNLDSLFCGIFPQEVAELEQKDDEYLKMVNIVPVSRAPTRGSKRLQPPPLVSGLY